MKKKFLSVLLIVAVLIGMAGVSGTQTESGKQKADKEQKQQENEQTAMLLQSYCRTAEWQEEMIWYTITI